MAKFSNFTSNTQGWVDFNSLTSTPIDSKVWIQNIGSGGVFFQCSATTPTDTNGSILLQEESIVIPKSQGKLWLKSPDVDSINIIYTLGDFGNYIDHRVYDGLKAFTVQPFTEANVKNSTQWEFSSLNPSLTAGAVQDAVFTTGSSPVLIKSRQITFTGSGITAQVYEAPTFTGGTLASIYNLNRIAPNSPLSTIRTGVTTSATGTEIAAPTYAFGTDTSGNKAVGTFSAAGIERVLKPNTAYLLRITNNDTAACKVAVYTTFYEGELSSLN